MDYRPLPEDRTEEYKEYIQYAFSPEKGPQEEYGWDPADQPGHPRALFDGDRMLCICRQYWFRTRLRGQRFEMPGLSAIASPPEHRRKGHVTRLMVESLEEYRDRGDFLTALWPFEFPFYERFGWGVANKTVQYSFDPDTLSFARNEAQQSSEGEFRRVELEEYERLEPVLAADAEGYELAIDRTERWWRKRVFESLRGNPYVYAWETDGQFRGYVVYRIHDESDGKRLDVEELAATDLEARTHLLGLLANHDSQVERVSIYGPHDTSLLDVADDPAAVECQVKPGPMVRIVDVPTAFEAFSYPEVADAEFTLSVTDSLADWNDGTFRVTVTDGRATCEQMDDDGTDADAAEANVSAAGTNADPDRTNGSAAETSADVTTGVDTLAQVVVGYHSVEDAETFGDLELREPAARETLVSMFPSREVFLREGF